MPATRPPVSKAKGALPGHRPPHVSTDTEAAAALGLLANIGGAKPGQAVIPELVGVPRGEPRCPPARAQGVAREPDGLPPPPPRPRVEAREPDGLPPPLGPPPPGAPRISNDATSPRRGPAYTQPGYGMEPSMPPPPGPAPGSIEPSMPPPPRPGGMEPMHPPPRPGERRESV